MASREEIMALGREIDAQALEDAARVVRRRMKKPAGISTALFCRTLTSEASMLRAEARTLREDESEPSGQFGSSARAADLGGQ